MDCFATAEMLSVVWFREHRPDEIGDNSKQDNDLRNNGAIRPFCTGSARLNGFHIHFLVSFNMFFHVGYMTDAT